VAIISTANVQSLCEDNRAFFIDALEELRKATPSFFRSVLPSVRVEELGSHWRDFHQILYLNIFLKSVEKTQI